MYTDSISDFITRIRNGSIARKKIIETPSSKINKEISKILFDQGYILSYKIEKKKFEVIKIALKYDVFTKNPVIKSIKRLSKPSLRIYRKYKYLPRILNGFGIAIISTSKGLMTEKRARRNKIGGEIICSVY